MASTSVGSSCDVSSSDSSEEDGIGRFLEAAVLDCHHTTSLNGKTATKSLSRNGGLSCPRNIDRRSSKPSLRPSKQESHEAENELNTTPEFRAFVGKKLSQILDSMIEVSGEKKAQGNANSVPEELGVRLFSSSSHHVCLNEISPIRKVVKKRPVESSSSDSSEDERLASAAVSHDFIFKDIKPTEVEKSALGNTDTVVDVAKKKKKKKKKKKHKDDADKCGDSCTSENGETENSINTGKIENNGTPRCKKKKKKKDKNLENG